MTVHLIACIERPNPIFRLFKSLRVATDEPERVEAAVTETQIRFLPIKDEDEGPKITQSTGDVSAAGIVSEHALNIEEGRYEAVSVEVAWAIDIGKGQPDPVGGHNPFVDELRDAIEEGNIAEKFTVDEIRVNRTEIDVYLLEVLIETDG